MKQLIIGIDGGDREIFSQVSMPYLHELFEDCCTFKLTEDLLSRGWAEILSGKYARDTKAFYMKPKLDGTRDLVFRFSLKDMLSNPEVSPIWEIPTRCNQKVGMMNVPTTFPAQPVEGFFVSGAGGGVNKVEGIPEDLCYPKSLAKELEELSYVIDIRVGTAGIRDIQLLFDKLNEMQEKRVEAFIRLCKQHQTDFGFIATRATTDIQYLAMSELQSYFAYRRGELTEEEANQHAIWFENFEKHYILLDNLLKRLIKELNPEHFIVTSDHGAVPYKYKANFNAFLQRYGYQKQKLLVRKTLKSLINSFRWNKPFKPVYRQELERVIAFGNWYLSGIFINDSRRFNGLVKEDEIDEVVARICHDFNKSQEAKKYEMEAKPYRKLYPDAKYNDYLPDIKIHCPTSIFAVSEGPFIRPNEDDAPLPNLNNVKGGMHSGQKGEHPLFCCDQKTATMIQDKDTKDLTLVYKLTERIFNS